MIITIPKIIQKLFPPFPNWLDAKLEIIDEIINALLGGSSMETNNKLSRTEQNFLEETRLLVLLENARENKSSSGEEAEF